MSRSITNRKIRHLETCNGDVADVMAETGRGVEGGGRGAGCGRYENIQRYISKGSVSSSTYCRSFSGYDGWVGASMGIGHPSPIACLVVNWRDNVCLFLYIHIFIQSPH